MKFRLTISLIQFMNIFMAFSFLDGVLGTVLVCAMILYAFGMILFFMVIKVEKDLKKQHMASQNIMDTAKIMVFRLGYDGTLRSVNGYAQRKLRVVEQDVIDRVNIYDLLEPLYAEKLSFYVDEYRKGHIEKDFELSIYDIDKKPVYALFNFNCTLDDKDSVEILGIDFTERVMTEKHLEEKHNMLQTNYSALSNSEKELRMQVETIKKLVFYDSSTGIANRSGLQNKAEMISGQGCTQMSLLFLDMDDFRLINDTYGYDKGDLILKQIASDLSKLCGNEAMVSRTGGDEFSILLWNYGNHASIINFIHKIQTLTLKDSLIENSAVNLTFSIGIACSSSGGNNFELLYKNAVTAMYHAKKIGKNKYVFYNEEMDFDDEMEKLSMQGKLRNAIINNELSLVYQPQVATGTNSTLGFEALLRWRNSNGVEVPPSKFIKIAEESWLIIPIGAWVMQKAIEFISKVHQAGYPGLFVAVNISVIQLMQPEFVKNILVTLDTYGVSPSNLELEITESSFMESIENVVENIELLRSKGVRFALDDFGTGYSSLNYLMKLPVDTLKIEKSFIDNISLKDDENHIIGSIIDMAKKTGCKVVAEGVETLTQYRYLAKKKCDVIQGYLFGKPVPGDEIINNLQKGGKKNIETVL